MTRRHTGFTLLEVLLASLIAVMLLAALYVAMDVTLTQTDVTREQVASSDLSRAVINRMATDFGQALGPMPPLSGGGTTSPDVTTSPSGGQTSQAPMTQQAPAAGAGTGGATANAQPATGTTTTSTTTTTTSTDPTTGTTTNIPFPAGVIGTDKQLVVYASRVPLTLTDPDAAAAAASNPDAPQPADLRRVVYYLASDGSGLCRQERPWVTADGVWNSTDPDRSDERADLIAPEVKDVTFEYLDPASGWVTEWDGTTAGSDGVTLTGPPRAVRVTLTVEVPGKGGKVTEKRVQHVFAVRAAVGMYVPDTSTAGTTGTTGGTGP